MINKDLHSHTVYCDGDDTPERMVQAAMEKGLSVYGVSAHSYTSFDTRYCLQKEDIPRYIAEMRYLRAAYYDKIHVLCGVEQDYYSDCPTDEFDYAIGSVHYLLLDGEYVPIDDEPEILLEAVEKYFGGDIYALCEEYFRTASDVVNKTGCDIIGHFDLIAKFNEGNKLFDESHPRYVAAWKAAADELLKYGVPFEINYGAVNRGIRSQPYLAAVIQDYIRERGGTFVMSSDAHRAEDILTALP